MPLRKQRNQDRMDLMFKKELGTSTNTRIITKYGKYGTEHQEVYNIFAKYWYLLLGDEKVAKFVSSVPSIT